MSAFKGLITVLGLCVGVMAMGGIVEATTRTGFIGLIAVFVLIFSILALVLFMATEEQ